MAKYRLALSRVKTRDSTLRYTEKLFHQDFEEEAVIKGAQQTLLYVPITSNRGSCGALNSNTFKYVETILSKNTKLMPIGKKGNDSLSKLFPKEFTFSIINDMKQPMHFGFATYIFDCMNTVPNVERTQILFTRYISAGIQRNAVYNIPVFDKWLEKISVSASTENDKKNYLFANAVLNLDDAVIRDFYDFHSTLAILNAVSENELSEYAARIVAVEGQLTNIAQLQARTLYLYNKMRQGSITASLIEILSAMNAMEGNAAKGVKRTEFWSAKA
jgi:F-type H+-transporting ATPase subunit gamma